MSWNTTKTKQKRFKQKKYIIGHSGSWFSKFLSSPSTLCYNSFIRFPEWAIPLFPTSEWLFVLSLWSLNEIFWCTQLLSNCSEGNSFCGFLNTFFLCIESDTLFIRTFLPLYHNLILIWFLPLKISSFFCAPPPKIQKSSM